MFRALCNPGDELLVPAPSYPLFGFLADIHDVRLVHYPLIYDHGWQIDFHCACKERSRRGRVGSSWSIQTIPTGHFVKPEELATLNEICATRDLALIADEVFLDFAHESTRTGGAILGRRHVRRVGLTKSRRSLATNNGALTFTMSGLSKISGLPQMKAAWLVTSGPEALKKQALERIEVIADTYLSMNAPIQLALPAFLAAAALDFRNRC